MADGVSSEVPLSADFDEHTMGKKKHSHRQLASAVTVRFFFFFFFLLSGKLDNDSYQLFGYFLT